MPEYRITFLVTVPENTPTDSDIYICGNHKNLGGWVPNATKLNKVGERQYQASFIFNEGTHLDYKFTRGSWETVEKDQNFFEYPDRSVYVTKGRTVHFAIHNWADMGKPKLKASHTWSGIIKEHNGFLATKLGNKRNIWVYLPPNYPKSPSKRYPVLYAHDGNNVFDSRTAFLGVEWELDETAEKLVKEKKIREVIIVAIENNIQRQEEYTHVYMENYGGGKADLYADFIINDLKPFIDKTYRTLKHRQYTGIMGSSLGGLVSMYISWKYSDVFSMAGVVSPSVWWGNKDIIRFIKENKLKNKIKIWLDIGTLEGKMDDDDDEIPYAVHDTRLLRDTLVNNGFKLGYDLAYFEIEGARHNEAAWAKRVDKILLYFFGKQRFGWKRSLRF
ncbi:alpha/beta hydrolase-fold protein [Candidatus Uabimicrobium helgolandensis]